MSDLLTTKELQERLCVDRKTIYRMLKDGRLPAVRVGGQWRFQRQTIDAWLNEPGAMQNALASESVRPVSTETLPLDCFIAVQEVFAEAMDIGAVTTDYDGEILIMPSNSCAFCDLILAAPEGRRRCKASWARLSRTTSAPRIECCHAGLAYARGRIQVGDEFIGMVFAGQFLTDSAHRKNFESKVETLAEECHIPATKLQTAAQQIRVLDPQRADKTLYLLQKLADTFSGIGELRLELLTRLRQVARLSDI